jgi:hypothetical protein
MFLLCILKFENVKDLKPLLGLKAPKHKNNKTMKLGYTLVNKWQSYTKNLTSLATNEWWDDKVNNESIERTMRVLEWMTQA